MIRLVCAFLFVLAIQGCQTLGHQEFFTQTAPVKYPPVNRTLVFEYPNANLKELYKQFFSDFLIIGHSDFNGPYENPTLSIPYAQSIGADILVTTFRFKEERTSYIPLTTPTTNTTNFSGYAGNSAFSGTATTFGTQTTNVPITVTRFDQAGIYLRNVNKIMPLWEKTVAHYPKTTSHELDGLWFNQNYRLNLYRSNQDLVAIVETPPKDPSPWLKGQLKFLFNAETGSGIYLMGNKTPMPAQFAVNKFGHLEVTLANTKETFSFTR